MKNIINYKFISFLFSWIFPTKETRRAFRNLCNIIEDEKEIAKIHNNYTNLIKKLRKKDKYKVVFLINENSKWKAQSLYDLMQESSLFEPIILLTIADIQKKIPVENKKQILNDNYNFFKSKNMSVEIAYDVKKDKAYNLSKYNPDLVFYQQPYKLPKNQDINKVSKFALTYYIPYYLPDYENLELDCEFDFHNSVYKYYILNEYLKNTFENHLKKINKYKNDNIVVVGHPILDIYVKNKPKKTDKNFVIYAPHWSIKDENNENNINISTFDKNGEFILNYAKTQQKNINWVFKPHPTLKEALNRIGWSKEKIDNYFSQWESFALCCYDGNYSDLFEESEALITDCGSFKLEYFCTGKPILHLATDYMEHPPYKFMEPVLKSLYEIKNNEELKACIETVILNKNDYKKENRASVLKTLNILEKSSASRIYENLVQDLQKNKGISK